LVLIKEFLMKILKIFLCAAFIFTIAACESKDDHHYEYPDDDPTTEKGNIGDPCVKNDDCKDGLFCIDKKCGRPSPDEDTNDDDNDADTQDDTNPDDDTDTDTDTGDHDADTDADDDTDTNDDDEPDDTDTQPDEDSDTTPYNPECGNGITEMGEECDNGFANSDEPGDYDSTCRTNCKFAGCGDNITDNSEACDDGNRLNGDYCSADCQTVTGYCGDGIQQNNEECDPKDDPYCSNDCSEITGFCGDGIIQLNEKCDKANPGEGGGQGTSPYYCSFDCMEITGWCGDNERQIEIEECDDGTNNGKYNYCNTTCSNKVFCGDGIVQPAYEKCDDGNNENGDYCSADCQTSYGSCGDGTVQWFEACDKANPGEGGKQGIGAYCSNDCKTVLGECGDSEIQTNAGEECDNGEFNGNTGCPYGTVTGCEVCSSNCKKIPGIPRYCGDGVIQAGEVCDPALDPYCSSDCKKIEGSCGDGIKQSFEACDTALDPYCSSDCKRIEGSCGDNTKNGNEECDLGSNNGKTDCAYGNTSCKVCTLECKEADGTPHYCGDHRKDEANGERCDDGSELNGTYGYCKSDCTGIGEHCGDSIKNGNEDCDLGEGVNGTITDCAYGETSCKVCTSGCKEADGNTSYCGDGRTDTANGEACDKANDPYCADDCRSVNGYCGDGIKQDNEACDDGNNDNNDYCSYNCQTVTGYCGDGTRQLNEACDNADPSVGAGEGIGDYCSFDCQQSSGYCGDGTVQTNEACDDGNNLDGDYCSADCQTVTGSCGDGTVQTNEACDDGNNLDGDYCSADCQTVTGSCGDGTKQDIETCDDGDGVNGTYNHCNSSCDGYMPRCGDENIDTDYGEVCDEGAVNGTYLHCSSDCTYITRCGDGVKQPNENCDDGDENGSYGLCNNSCTGITGKCGDGIWQNDNCGGAEGCIEITGGPEECDYGYQNGATECEYGKKQCYVCTLSCMKIEGNTSYCGDGNIDYAHGEACDDGDDNGDFGKCDTTCKEVVTWKCGDGNIDWTHGETCDDGDDNGTPEHCNSTCSGPTPYCGDGRTQREDCGSWPVCNETLTENCCEVIEGMSEKCDDGEWNDRQGYCYSDCSGYCGDGKIQREDCGSLPLCDENTTENCCVVSAGVNEVCDEGYEFNGQIGHCNWTCDDNTAVCGNGIVEKGEACDDGDDNGKYGKCDPFCKGDPTLNGYCGDGKVQKSDPEHCGTLPLCTESVTQNCCEIKSFGAGIPEETCDEGKDNNGYHGHCNLTCSGISSCGDGELGKDEICEPGTMESAFQCNMIPQFSTTDESIMVTDCDSDCMPVFDNCVYDNSYTSPFFTTGQILCYNNSAADSCPVNETDDFYGQEPQFSYMTHDFEVIANGEIIVDNASGLMWQTDTPSIYSAEIKETYYTCEASSSCTATEADYYCSFTDIGGYSNWRLPTAAELSTIMDYASASHLYSGFTNTSGSYWTSDGIVFSSTDGTSFPSTGTAKIKCVRTIDDSDNGCTALQCSGKDDESTFILESPDMTMLFREVDDMYFTFWHFDSLTTGESWKNALATCAAFDNSNGINKMRLPTVNELMWLIDRENGGSLIYGFAGKAWTSTTFATDPSKAYAVDFSTGSVVTDTKGTNNIVICVE
jgi:cysteine-rich repeat protein